MVDFEAKRPTLLSFKIFPSTRIDFDDIMPDRVVTGIIITASNIDPYIATI